MPIAICMRMLLLVLCCSLSCCVFILISFVFFRFLTACFWQNKNTYKERKKERRKEGRKEHWQNMKACRHTVRLAALNHSNRIRGWTVNFTAPPLMAVLSDAVKLSSIGCKHTVNRLLHEKPVSDEDLCVEKHSFVGQMLRPKKYNTVAYLVQHPLIQIQSGLSAFCTPKRLVEMFSYRDWSSSRSKCVYFCHKCKTGQT